MAEVKEVVVPDIGDFDDIPIIAVLVGPGDTVAPEDPLVEIESDKATMEVPAPFGGTVRELRVAVGDKVSMGTPLLTLEVAEDGSSAAADEAEAAQTGTPPGEAAAPASVASAVDAESQALEGEPPPASTEPSGRDGDEPDGAPPYASPSVRRLARERGIDLRGVTGSGRKGRIVPDDLDRAAAPGPAAPGGDGAGLGLDLAPWPVVDFERFGEVERVPLSRIRRISKTNLARNWVHIAHVTHHEDADITDLEAFRKQLNAEQSDVKVTMVALLLKACASTLQAFPDFNASLDGDELVRKRYYHLGFAADTPGGLVVPVVRDVDRKGLLELAGELADLSGKARAGKLGPGEMSGGTFTISSLGGIGGTGFTPIVNAPEVAILGVVRSATKPVWDGAAFVPRLMLPLSLSYDHRVIDGAAAARFCVHLAGVLADLRRVLL